MYIFRGGGGWEEFVECLLIFEILLIKEKFRNY